MQTATWLLYSAFVFILSSVAIFSFGQKRAGLVVLAVGAFLLRLHMAHLDPFLHDWDEKFHALAARNFMDNPLKPILKSGMITSYDYRSWCCNYVWVHKQPLFMWQMALSMKIFGISEYAIRYPDVLMGSLMVLMVYRIGKLVTGNATIGFMSAMFMCCSNYQLELISGYHGMDHNDVVFGFYVLASIWAYAEYINSGKFKWVIWIGVFAGCAILNKWLTGLLVFAGWGINMMVFKRENFRKEVLHILAALLVCAIIFLPWQLYILSAFPIEANYEFVYNSKHVTEVVEGHGGDEWAYWDNFPLYINVDLWKLFPVGMLIVLILKKYRNKYGIVILTTSLVVYSFFSFIVTSKMQSYMYVVVPLFFIFIAITTGIILSWMKMPVVLQLCLAGYFCFLLLDVDDIDKRHNPKDDYRIAKAYNTTIYRNLKCEIPPNISVISNLGGMADVECMFYNPGITAYHHNISPEDLALYKRVGRKVAAFEDHNDFILPDYLKNDPDVFIIHKALK